MKSRNFIYCLQPRRLVDEKPQLHLQCLDDERQLSAHRPHHRLVLLITANFIYSPTRPQVTDKPPAGFHRAPYFSQTYVRSCRVRLPLVREPRVLLPEANRSAEPSLRMPRGTVVLGERLVRVAPNLVPSEVPLGAVILMGP